MFLQVTKHCRPGPRPVQRFAGNIDQSVMIAFQKVHNLVIKIKYKYTKVIDAKKINSYFKRGRLEYNIGHQVDLTNLNCRRSSEEVEGVLETGLVASGHR